MNTNQFDPRYRLPPGRTDNPGAKKRSRIVLHQQTEALARISHRPAQMDFFERALAGDAPLQRPLIGYFCNMIPVEIIHALGARAIRLDCGNAALVQPGEEVLAGEICPLAKSSFATFLDANSPSSQCDALVVPSSCDAKRKLAEVLADYKPTFLFNMPAEQDAGRYLDATAAEVRRMADFLSSILGRTLARTDLRHAIQQTLKRTAAVRELQELRSASPALLSIRDFFIMIQASFAGIDLDDWTYQARQVIDELRNRLPERKRIRPRIILTGAPMVWPNFKILNLIEECGADVVADTLCTGAQSCFDPVVTGEGSLPELLRALASRYVFASPCPCFASQGTRLSRILDLVREFKACGVINYCLRLCPLFDVETYRLSRILKERRIPMITLRTDYSLEDTEQLRVRLEAFLETVENT